MTHMEKPISKGKFFGGKKVKNPWRSSIRCAIAGCSDQTLRLVLKWLQHSSALTCSNFLQRIFGRLSILVAIVRQQGVV